MVPRILIVDDDADSAESFSALLELEGYEVRWATGGAEALGIADRWAPWAACLDLAMPDMSGFEVADALRRTCLEPPLLLAMTGLSRPGTELALARSGFSACLVKPCDPAELVATLDAWNGGAHRALKDHPLFARDFEPLDRQQLLELALDAALAAANAPKGNVQLVDGQGELRIRAQRGFDAPFLRHFDRVAAGSTCACGTALGYSRQVFVGDVESHPAFDARSRAIVLEAGARAVTSSPILGAAGELLGMISTHHPVATCVAAADLPAQRWVASRTARWLAPATTSSRP